MECNGVDWNNIEQHIDLVIQIHGFIAQQVSGGKQLWTYTVGMSESWGHPELLCAGLTRDAQATLVGMLADDIEEFGGVRPATLDSLDIALVPIDERQFRNGLVASWEARYQRSAATGDFLRIVPGPSWHRRGSCCRRGCDRGD